METINIKNIPELLIKSELFENFGDEQTITVPKQYFSYTLFDKEKLNVDNMIDVFNLLKITDFWCVDFDISSKIILKYAMKIFIDDQFKKSTEDNKDHCIELFQQLNIPLAKELLFLLTFKKNNYKKDKYFNSLMESKKDGVTFGHLKYKQLRYLIYRTIKNNCIEIFKYLNDNECINFSTDVYTVSLFGSLDILKYMHLNGYNIKNNIGHSYLYNDKDKVLEYLINNGYFYYKTSDFTQDDCCLFACKSSAPKCLELFHNRGHPLLINLKYLIPYKDKYFNKGRFEECIKYVLENINEEKDQNYQYNQKKDFDNQIVNYCVIHNLSRCFKIAIDKGYKCDTGLIVLCANYNRIDMYNYFLKVRKPGKN